MEATVGCKMMIRDGKPRIEAHVAGKRVILYLKPEHIVNYTSLLDAMRQELMPKPLGDTDNE